MYFSACITGWGAWGSVLKYQTTELFLVIIVTELPRITIKLLVTTCDSLIIIFIPDIEYYGIFYIAWLKNFCFVLFFIISLIIIW